VVEGAVWEAVQVPEIYPVDPEVQAFPAALAAPV